MKLALRKLWEKLTGRKCSRCRYNRAGRCIHPSGSMFAKCWPSITRPGFEKKPPRYLKTSKTVQRDLAAGEAAAQGLMEGLQHELTPEEKHQMEKIKLVLQEAEDAARESGLISED